MNFLRNPIAITFAVLALAGCSSGDNRPDAQPAKAQPNISLARSPNNTRIGTVDPHRETVAVPVLGRTIVTAFRASECGQSAPNFARMMDKQARGGLRVPDGITLYDAGIGHYTSKRCGATAEARAIGVYGVKRGTYELHFFEGKVNRIVKVQ
jgi:hypothetical protein